MHFLFLPPSNLSQTLSLSLSLRGERIITCELMLPKNKKLPPLQTPTSKISSTSIFFFLEKKISPKIFGNKKKSSTIFSLKRKLFFLSFFCRRKKDCFNSVATMASITEPDRHPKITFFHTNWRKFLKIPLPSAKAVGLL